MKKIIVALLAGFSFLISQTKTWQQSTSAEFSFGTPANVAVTNTNGGELQLVHPLVRQQDDTLDSSIPQFVDYDDSGNYVSGWISNERVYVQKFDASKQPLSAPILVDDSAGVYSRSTIGIALLNSGKFIVGWRALQSSIGFEVRYVQFFDASGAKIGTNLRMFGIVDGTGSIPRPIADRTNERYLIISPERGSDNNTYQLSAAIYSADAIKVRDSIDMVPVGGTMQELNPRGAFYNGRLVIAWDGDNTNYVQKNICVAFYDSNCVPITAPIILAQQCVSPAAAFDENGNCCVTWVYPVYPFPGPPDKLYAQVLSSSGKKIGGVIQLSNLKEGSIRLPNIIFANNMFRVAWEVGFSNGMPSQQWSSYWKLEQITNGNYISSVFDAGSSKIFYDQLFWTADTYPATRLTFQLRSAETSIGIPSAQWNGPTSPYDYYTNPSGETISAIHNSNRFIQIKAFLETDSVGISPVLEDFSISYRSSDTTAPLHPAGITVKGEHRRIVIGWAKSISADVKQYRIYRAIGNNDFDAASYIEVEAGKISCIDSSVVYSTQYRYGVAAIDSTFNESTMAQSVSVSPRTTTIFVSPSGSPAGEGTAAKPFPTINSAVNFSGEGDTIFVLPGEYSETTILKDGISLIGSSATTTKILSSSSYSVLKTGKSNIVKGFTFLTGGGITCGGENVLITENILLHQGGGFDVGISPNSYDNVVISKNVILNFSIGIQPVADLTPSVPRTTIRNNIIRCGTGVQNVRSNIAFVNNVFIVEGSSGIAISLAGGRATMMNNCFAGYPSEGGFLKLLMYAMDAAFSFQYNNRWNFNADPIDSLSSSNISVDPQFKSVFKNNFHLSPASLCINNGNPAVEYNDIDGSRNDIGAYGGPDPIPEYITFSLVTDLSLNNVSGFPGDTVSVEIILSKAAGLKNAAIVIQFDHSVMTFLKAATTPLNDGFTLKTERPSDNKVTLLLNSEHAIPSGNGSISSLKFVLHPIMEIEKRSAIEIGTVGLFDDEQNPIYISSVVNGSCIVRATMEHPYKVFVDGSHNGIEEGTILHPYSTIQEGIDNAQPGDTVVVAAGTYTGPIVMRDRIFVIGLGANVTTIKCPDDPLISTPTVVRFKNVSSTGIKGFSLINYASLGTVIEITSSDVCIAMNKIDQSGMAMASVVANSDSRVVIQDNYFIESKFGGFTMIDMSANDASISRNVFSPSSSQDLIVLRANEHATVSNNRFYLQNGRGLVGFNTKKMLVANNLYLGGKSGGFGINLIDAESTLVVNNIFDICRNGIEENNGTQQIYNNMFVGNDVALHLESPTKHQYNLLWNNALNLGNGPQDSTEIEADPYFVDQLQGNYNLLPLSPATNAGHPAAQWNDKDGTRNDVGLYGGPYADRTMFTALNSKLCIRNVPGSPCDTIVIPIYAIGITGISGMRVLITYDADKLTLLETHTTAYTQDFVLLMNHIGSSIVELILQGYHSMVLDSGAIMEIRFVVSKNAIGNIPLKFQNVQLSGTSTQIIENISFENGEVVLSPNSVKLIDPNIPKDFILYQNFPNPFNPLTTITYFIPSKITVQLKVFDILGRELIVLRNEEQQAGTFQIPFNASTLSSGIYFYQLHAGNFTQTKKMLLLK